MNSRMQEIIDAFDMADDDEMRLQMLLDFSRRVPVLPERFHEARDAGINRVQECMTPVFLWVERDGDAIRLFVEVAEEAPTIKGLIGMLVDAYDNRPANEVAAIPNDLLHRLHLQRQIRMNRAVGFSGVIGRIKRSVAEAVPEKQS